MDIKSFVKIVKSFSVSPDDVLYERGVLTAEIQDQILELQFRERAGNLYCVEGSSIMSAGEWICRRIARMDSLARRLLDSIPEDPLLIPVAASYIDVIQRAPNGRPKATNDALACLSQLLNDLPSGMTNVVYLTSDAGEGKTCLIEGLARAQAQAYIERRTEWLLLPVSLGGRPFIRLDDVVTGALLNRFRFPYYYYESVIELMRMDVLVLGLDGFEEMFVEKDTGEAVSSIGNLVSRLDSKARLLVAARTAYYDHKDLRSQAKLFGSLGQADVSFSEMRLQRWTQEQFLQLANRTDGVTESGVQQLYDTVSSRLGMDHPLLTRAVLARRLIDEYVRSEDRSDLLNRLSKFSSERYFDEFVTSLLEREVMEKWIDRSGEVAKPLLNPDQHHEILEEIAEEMWLAGVDAIRSELVEVATELVVAERLVLGAEIVAQARRRITQHALLKSVAGTSLLSFDHEDFRSFYVGRRIAKLLLSGKPLGAKTFLQAGVVPDLAVRVATCELVASTVQMSEIITTLSAIAGSTTVGSFGSLNAGSLALSLVERKAPDATIEIKGLHFTTDALSGVVLSGVDFVDCVFERTSINRSRFSGVAFHGCEFVQLDLPEGTKVGAGIRVYADSVPQAVVVCPNDDAQSEQRHYCPEQIVRALKSGGMVVEQGQTTIEATVKVVNEDDEELLLVDRAIRSFLRATYVVEHVFRVRLGTGWPLFESSVLPALVDAGVFEEVHYSGSGRQRRYRLAVGLEKIDSARVYSKGDFQTFLRSFE